ncbi:MAG TPA: NBR1-Ig-like domain-containing protein, partial [Planctomycetota bacterium]|nr:NBR1-Ig-like domain-containing protein [Planctomycetota bacterium]
DGDDIAHWGGGWCNNHFWYHHENGKMRIIKWDPDASQGRFYQNADQPLGYQWHQTDMLDWIAGDAVVWNDYKAAVAAVLNGPATQVQSRIDAIYNHIRNEVYNDPLKSFSNAEYDSGKNWLKDWWNRRLSYLRTQVSVNNAAFVSQSVPTAMTAGQTYSVTVRMRNTGSTTWDSGYALGSQNPVDNTTWDADGRIPLGAGETVAPNAEKSFTWTVTAPATPGTYNFQWRMRESGVEWFGASSPNVAVVVSAPPTQTPADDADFVSQNVPSTMTAGQTYSVTVVFKNVGTATWTSAAGYTLTSRNATGNTTWGMSSVPLAGTDSIAPNQQKTFTWTVTAPAAAGTYDFQWSLMKGTTSFGDTSPNVAVVVSAPPTAPAYAAEFVSQTVPSTMVAGQAYSVTVRMKNTGTATWTDVRDDRLGSQNPQDNTTWGMNRVDLAAGTSVPPGQTATYTWTVTAPAVPGTYNFQWRMRQSLDDLWYGPLTPNVAVTVTAPTTTPPPTAGTNLAEYVSQTVVTTMTAGQDYTVSVTMKNAGTTTWTEAGKYRLTSREPRDNTTWGLNRVYLAPTDSIAPGQTHTFTFDVTAPTTPGTYVFRWSMVQDGVDVFEARTPATSITVAGSAPPPTTTPPPSSGGGVSTPVAESTKDNGESGLDPVFDKCSGSIGGGLAGPLLAGLALLLLAARRRA